MSCDTKIFIITGPCGVGKTSILPVVREKLPGFDVRDFDEVGVPENPTVEWRIQTTKFWVDQAIANIKAEKPMVILGMIVPGEVLKFVPEEFLGNFIFLLLEVSLEERCRRFKCRNEQRESILNERVNFDNLRSWLMSAPFQYDVIDTTELKLEETANQVVAWIRSRPDTNSVYR